MTEGIVAEWHIPDGATVAVGAPLYKMETEKIALEVEAEAAGIVRHGVPAGTKTTPGALIGYILAAGEALPAGFAPAATPVAGSSSGGGSHPSASVVAATVEGGRIASSPGARRLAKEAGMDLASIRGTGPEGRITEADVLAAKAAPRPSVVAAPAGNLPREVLASPLARKLAERLGVSLAGVHGTGPGGRITQEDVEAFAAAPRPSPVAAPVAAGGEGQHSPGERIPLRGMRKVIAERMHASLQQMAQLTMAMDVAMDEAVKLRGQMVDEWAAEGVRPSYTDLVIKAVGKALRQHPLLNATMHEMEIELLAEVHVGMAVAVPDGLLVPVVRNADRLSLKEIAAESTRLAEAARTGKLGLDEMAGGTFSVTALGMSGVDFFTPVINPPNVAILGVGRIHDTVAWEGDRPVKGQVMTLSLTIDHRAVDGAPGAAFLATVRDLLEAPYRLLV
jgi:pyruvate/2-oxoglutarate dehydrogenase complex dihydrolipoamide acyltransferase (E2) component